MSKTLQTGFTFGGRLDLIVKEDLRAQIPKPVEFKENSDEYWMSLALQDAMKSVGITSPNPAVGCLVVKDGKILSRGVTLKYGDKHAERCALEPFLDMREKLDGSTLYITLEPCTHQGKQPPCLDLVKEFNFARVVIGSRDPNRLVAGKGIQGLKAHGVKVDVDILHNECIAWNYGFFINHQLKRPLLAVKWAQSLDGQLADDENGFRWISGEVSRSYSHWLRQKYDVVCVGAQTLLNDMPKLDVRDCAEPHQAQPVKMVFDPKGRLVRASKKTQIQLIKRTFAGDKPTVIVCSRRRATAFQRSWLKSLMGKEILLLPLNDRDVFSYFQNHDLISALSDIRGRPVQSILVEGGPKLLSGILEREMADVMHVFIAPFLLGSKKNKIAQSTRAKRRSGIQNFPRLLADAHRYHILTHEKLGNDILIEAVPQNRLQKIF